jgi:hypothetical protein
MDHIKKSSQYLGTVGKYAGMIDHPTAKKIAGYANTGASVAKSLGFGKRKHRRTRR